MDRTTTSKALLGAAVAGILSAGFASADPIPAEKLKCTELVPCYGVNACKAHGSCSSATHGCQGQNSCKGTGWLPMPKDSCTAIEGSLKPTAASKKG